MLMLFGMLHSLNAAEIVINEVLVDATGTDAGHEWIELYNSSAESVDLSGWQIQWGTSSYSGNHVIGGLALGPGEYILLGGEWVEGRHELAEFNFGNAGSNADSLRIVDSDDVVVDTLVYGSPNSDGWVDDFGVPAVSLAPMASSGETIARLTDGVDTDFSGTDFSMMEDPSPGRSNMLSDTGTPAASSEDTGTWACEGADSIKINEVMYDPDSSDAGLEWVELYNAGETPVSLGGWSLESGTSSYSVIVDFEDGLVMMPGDFVLVGDELVPDTDVTAGLSLGNAGSSSDALRLVDCEGMPADTLVYGSPNTDEWEDDSGAVASSLAPKSGSGFSIARIADGFDTDESATDWMASETNTPGASNPETAPVECVAGYMDVVINEFVSNPDGTDTDQEWVELYNRSDTAVVLDGWVLAWGKNGTYTGAKTFGGGTLIEAGGFILIGGAMVDDIDVAAGLDLGNAGSNADAIQLVDCEGYVQDTVIYGSPNDEGWTDDSGAVATSLTETPGSAESAARIEDGVDTDDCGADFVLSDAPTPGMPNDSVGPVDCELGEMVIKINEILPNPEGTDAENEFVELYNPSDSTVAIGGWGLSAATSTWPGAPGYIFPEGAT
ncbi:MAG: lamin tail domain-containing protein, partial [Myxococcota bacterium]